MLSDVREAIVSRDPVALARSAHALKSAVGNFEARQAVETARILESIGQSGQIEEAEGPLAELEQIIARLQDALTSTLNFTPNLRSSRLGL